jgi:RNA polymerase sigma factor (sigma-70 family)
MHDASDMNLLRQYAGGNSDNAFAALVSRHVNLVYSAALRKAGNPHAAEEITQAVFIILAQKAGRIPTRTILPGWLYQTAWLTAANYLKRDIRRVRREQEAFMQSQSDLPRQNETAADETWQQLAPLLEDAMGQLGDKDRAAVLLRFFGGRSFAEVATAAGVSENAAKKRVTRALEKLRKFFTKRGVGSAAETIAGAISAHSVQAAPALLAKSVTAIALAKGATASASTLTLIKGALKIMAWTKMKTAAVAVVAVIVATGTTTLVIKTTGRGKAIHPAETLAKAGLSPGIFNNGINNAQTLPNTIYTYPQGDETTHRYLEAVLKRFRKDLDPARAIKSDRELTEQDIQTRTIFIYGSPQNHSLFRRVRDQLPIVFEDDGIVVGGKKCVGADVGAIFVCPNPLNPKNRLVIYGTVSPSALKNMNGIFHGPTDYIIFNNATRAIRGVNDSDRFLLLGSFDKTDPSHWQVDEALQVLPPKVLQAATPGVVMAYAGQ